MIAPMRILRGCDNKSGLRIRTDAAWLDDRKYLEARCAAGA
jgi:hypothetical protein